MSFYADSQNIVEAYAEMLRHSRPRGTEILESTSNRVDEMAMQRISSVIQNPSLLAKNWRDVNRVMKREMYDYDRIPASGRELRDEASSLVGSAEDGYMEVNPEEYNLYYDFRDGFYDFLLKNGFDEGQETRNGVWLTDGNDSILFETPEDWETGMPFVICQAKGCEGRFASLVKRYLDDMANKEGWDASVEILTPDGRFWGNSVEEVASKMCQYMNSNPKSRCLAVLKDFLFDDDNEDSDEYDDIFAQAEEIGDEQYSSSIMAQGSDAYGDRDFARMDFLSKRIPREKWWKYGIYDPREALRGRR